MKNIFLKIAATLALLLGIMATITGTRVLAGDFDPGYTVHFPLVYYNVAMGLVSITAGILIWIKHRFALSFSTVITVGHILVLISLLTLFNDIIARQSVIAMLFRSTLWVIIFGIIKTIGND